MTDIDTQLRDVFARISEPGDPAGVAESIRTRMDAGDTGTPAPNGGRSSGFGGGGWFAPIAPWVGLVIIVGMLGGALGAFGVFGHPAAASTAVSVSVTGGVDARSCPGGAVLERFTGGERVVATQRSAESDFVAVRDPYNLALSVWLPADLVVFDDGQPGVDTLPVGGCPVAEVVEITPTPTSEPTSSPTSNPKPKPTKKPTADTTKPVVSVGSFSPNPVYGKAAAPYCDTKATVTVTATDNKGIASVKASATFGTIKQKSHSGNKWVFSYSADYNSGSDKSVTVTFTVKDAAGNSTKKTKSLTLVSAGNCLI
jgi:hypothetical protein